MTRRDFQLIADALRRSRPMSAEYEPVSNVQWQETVRVMSDHLAATNPRFDRARFVAACETAR